MPPGTGTGAAGKSGGGKPGGKQGTSSGTGSTHQSNQNFWDFNPRNIAGLNRFQTGAGQSAAGQATAGNRFTNRAQNYLTQLGGGSDYYRQSADKAGAGLSDFFRQATGAADDLRSVSGRQVTGANIESDPAYNAARRAFSNSINKRIQNASALSGLGRSSTLHNAQAAGESQYLLPVIEETLAREERGIGREMSGIQNQIQTLMGSGSAEQQRRAQEIAALNSAGGAEQQARSGAASGFGGLAEAERANNLNTTNQLAALGGQYRDVEQQQLDAPYEEQQRLWAEALNSMYGPLGMVGSMLGGTSSTSKK